ncbi:hypothetical protein M3Y96_01139500 [Aphelenchoides besseyi]|nr:hypothetical protein M3Y96_01139500 [Aphelenchoides besseyi]
MVATPSTLFNIWSYLFGVSNIAMDSYSTFAPRAIRLDSDGHCLLFDGLQRCAKTMEQQRETWSLISDLRSNVLWDDDLTDDMRMVYAYEKLHGFYVRHSNWLEDCAKEPVNNGMDVQRFIQIAKRFKQIRNLKKVLGGSPSLLVELLTVLKDEETLDVVVRDQLQMMTQNLNEYFAEEPRIFKRLAYVVAQTTDLLNPQENGVYVDIELGRWGSFDDLIHCYAYVKRHGWHWNDKNERSERCNSMSVLVRPRADNSSALIDAIETSWSKWTIIHHRADFKGFFKRIKKLVRGDEVGITSGQRLVEIAKILNNFAPSSERHEEIMRIAIPGYGTIRDFCECQSVSAQ